MVRVSVRVPARFLLLVDHLAATNRLSRSSVLMQIFMLGLRDYAELQKLTSKLASSVPVSEHNSQDVPASEHTRFAGET